MEKNRQTSTAVDVVQRFRGQRLLVIGDAILDTYLEGTATRLSREAPVPVVTRQNEDHCPGGAANTAANLAALGADVTLIGIVGSDDAGNTLRATLRQAGVSDRWLVADPAVTTLHKTRVIADDQCLVRVDDGDLSTCDASTRQTLLTRIEHLFPRCEGIILSDYACGTIGDEIVQRLTQLRAERPCLLAVDARDLRRYARAGATVVTPNVDEARTAVAQPGSQADDPVSVARHLRRLLDADTLAITMADGGVLQVDAGGDMTRFPTQPVKHAGDVGAGDSFTAALTLALASGAPAPEAVQIGIETASIACTKQRTAVVTHRELLRRISLSQHGEPLSLREIAVRLDAERFAGKRIVFTNGCFDILHAGHVHLLGQAKALGDILVVGVNSNESVRRLKGARRPINREQDRLALVSALDAVDYALIFSEDTPAETIRALRPDIHAKGGDYTEETLPEIDAVREVGARVELLPLLGGRSTTSVIDRIRDLSGAGLVEQMP